MDITFNCVSSGSSGNCYFLETPDSAVFIDCGVPLKYILSVADEKRLLDKEIHLFITHEHHDHISGLKPFVNRFSPKIYASEGTASAIDDSIGHLSHIYVLKGGCEYDLSRFSVIPFSISHDCAEPFGYRFRIGEKVATFATDLGVVTKDVERFLCCTDVLVLESNYEPSLLKDGKYPAYLKKRIAGHKGHLSNRDAMKILGSVSGSGIGRVYLAHVSEENNDYALLENYASFCKKNYLTDTYVLRKETPETGIIL